MKPSRTHYKSFTNKTRSRLYARPRFQWDRFPLRHCLQQRVRLLARHNRTDGQYSGHTDILLSADFSPDGKHPDFQCGWHSTSLGCANWARSASFHRLYGRCEQCCFPPDGKFIATVSDDGTARLWDVDYQTIMEYLCSILMRDFTDGERIHRPVRHNRSRNSSYDMLADH